DFAAALATARASPASPALSLRRPRTLAVVAAGLALAVATGGVLRSRAGPTARLDPNVAATLPFENSSPAVSLAVLPLKNYSGNPGQEYFADGMTEELITTLTRIERLRVIAHQSVLQFKHSDRSVPDIARLLDVQYVVDGSVLQDEER